MANGQQQPYDNNSKEKRDEGGEEGVTGLCWSPAAAAVGTAVTTTSTANQKQFLTD